jgi:3-oxoacyl-[acyl-carrier protein] reductase
MTVQTKAKALEGKVALVTGGSRGIGRAISVAMAECGASVAIGFQTDREAAEIAKQQIEARGGQCITIAADVSQAEETSRLIREVERSLGEVDVLVNNAGMARPRTIDTLGHGDWHETLAVNLTSVFFVTHAVLPGMRRRKWGRIVNLSSTAAQIGGVVGPHYAASKAGILGLTRGYASWLAREGITVNAIAPALIQTDMVNSNPRARPDLIPLGRFGAVEEVASVAVMLACNAYITGQTINVNGGVYMS